MVFVVVYCTIPPLIVERARYFLSTVDGSVCRRFHLRECSFFSYWQQRIIVLTLTLSDEDLGS